jgi:hypothetical protein
VADRRVSVGVDADISGFSRALSTAAVEAKGFAHELESADGRMANLVQTGLALAPALVPLGAVAVPAVAALATQLGVAAVAGGTALLAFQGVGTALKALNTYQLAPTAENLAKLHEAMAQLAPAGRDFVRELQSLRPELQQLEGTAQAGLFPGLTEALDVMQTRLPQVEEIIAAFSATMGDLSAEAGHALAGSGWNDFFAMLEEQGPPILEDIAHATGDVVTGLKDLLVAFAPMSMDFSDGMARMAASFHAWADGLAQTQGFHDFVAYVESNGPRALSTLEALANALIQVVEAAAPVGSASLIILRSLADVLAAIADSPVGPILISAAAAIGVLGRSLALLKAVGLRGDGESMIARALDVKTVRSVPAAYRGVAAATAELKVQQDALAASAVRARDAQFALVPTSDKRAALRDYATAQQRVKVAEEGVAEAEKTRAAAMRGTLISVGKATAVAAGLAVATTGVADSMGFSNTATLGLMGTMAGPFGAAAGVAIGAVIDMRTETQSLADALHAADLALQGTSRSATQAALDSLKSIGTYGQIRAMLSGNLGALDDAIYKLQVHLDELKHPGTEGMSLLTQTLGLTQRSAVQAALSMDQFGASVDRVDNLLSKRGSLRAYQQALDDFRKALQQDGKTLDINTEKGRTNQAALDNIAQSALAVAKSMNKASRADFLTGVRRQFIEAATAAGMTDAAARRLATRLGLIGKIKAKPKVDLDTNAADAKGKRVKDFLSYLDRQKPTPKADLDTHAADAKGNKVKDFLSWLDHEKATSTLDANDAPALAAIRQVRAEMDALHDKTVSLTVIRHEGGGQTSPRVADGGQVRGPGTTTSDSIPAWLSDQEYVVRAAAVQHYGVGFFDAANAMRLADGGSPGETAAERKKRRAAEEARRKAAHSKHLQMQGYANSFDLTAGMSISALNHELESFSLSVRKAGGHLAADFGRLSKRARSVDQAYMRSEDLLKKETKARDDLLQQRDAAVSSAQGAFTSDIFGSSLSAMDIILGRDTSNAAKMNAALQTAVGNGLSGGLAQGLAASGNVRLAQQFAALSPEQIKAQEGLYAQRQLATSALGATTSGLFAPQIAAANAQIKSLQATEKQLTVTLNRLEKAIEQGTFRKVEIRTHANPDKIAKAVTKHQRHAGVGG